MRKLKVLAKQLAYAVGLIVFFFCWLAISPAFQTFTGVSLRGVTVTAFQGGSGDVVGPASSVNNALAQFSGTTGKLIKQFTSSGLMYSASGVPSTITTSGVVKVASGVPSVVAGSATDCVYVDGTSGTCGGVGSSDTAGTGLIKASGVFSVDTAAVLTYLSTTASLDFDSASSGRCSTDLTISLAGASTGDVVTMGLPATIDGGMQFNAWVSAADTIKVRACNFTASSINPTNQSFKVTIIRPF